MIELASSNVADPTAFDHAGGGIVLLNNLSTIVAAQLESPGGGGAARASNTNPNPNANPNPNLNPNPNPNPNPSPSPSPTPTSNQERASNTTNVLVSLASVCNCLGRMLAGAGSDLVRVS